MNLTSQYRTIIRSNNTSQRPNHVEHVPHVTHVKDEKESDQETLKKFFPMLEEQPFQDDEPTVYVEQHTLIDELV